MGAPWRKLWSSISLSKKVNQLSGEAALFWSWAIPHFSTHGLLKYDPEDLKLMIVPLRKEMTVDKISKYVEEILRVKLWLAFKSQDDKIILYDPKWFKMQLIRRDRIGKPTYNIKEMTQIFTLLQETPDNSRTLQELTLTPGDSRILPDMFGPGRSRQLPIEKEKEKEKEKEIKESTDREKQQPVDNSEAPESPPKEGALFENLFSGKVSFVDALCISIIASDPGFNPYQWITRNKARNPDALIHSLKRLKDALQSKMGKSITSWPYIEAILKDEDKNYNSREFDTQANKDKAEFKTLVENLKALQEKPKVTQ